MSWVTVVESNDALQLGDVVVYVKDAKNGKVTLVIDGPDGVVYKRLSGPPPRDPAAQRTSRGPTMPDVSRRRNGSEA